MGAQMVGGSSRRLSPDRVRTATTLAAVVLEVAAIYLGTRLVSAGGSTILAVAVLLVVTAALVVGKLGLDRYLVGAGSGGRRAEDTEALARLLASLPESWWVFRDFFFGGAGVEFLAVGPGGVYGVEVYRWLTRDTGSGFYERVTADLLNRTRELEAALARASGMGQAVAVQPVFACLEGEGLRLGELVLHPAAADLRHVAGVLIATRENLLPLLRAGGPHHGVRTRSLEADLASRLGRFLQDRTAGS